MGTPADDLYPKNEVLTWSRIAILESRRLVLEHARRRLRRAPSPELMARAQRLRDEVDTAEAKLRAALPPNGVPEISDHWRAAVERLIASAADAIKRHSERAASLPAQQRFEVAAEVEMLQNFIDEWRSLIPPRR